MRNDHLIIFMLQHKKNISLKDRVVKWFLIKNNPSYKGGDDVIIELRKRGYLVDVNEIEATYDTSTGNWIDNRLSDEVKLEITAIGEKALHTNELKSESVEEFFDKTFVRWGVVIGSGYGLISFFVDAFRYIKNSFFN